MNNTLTFTTVQATYSDAGSAAGSEATGKETSPLRKEYLTDKMASNEILSHLSKVRLLQVLLMLTISLEQTCQGVPMYNAYERDIAVLNLFFGESTVFGRWLEFKKDLIIDAQSTRDPRR